MNKLIIDLEATCTDKNEFPRYESEIIEIGAVLVNINNEIIGKFSSFVRPVRNPILTDFCVELTTITQDEVNAAKTFPEVMEEFKKWMDKQGEFIFCSWGNYDKNQFRRCSEYHGIENYMDKHEHTNIKKAFAKTNNVKPCGLSKAMNISKIPLEGTLHRGIDDAINMAKIMHLINI